PTAWIGGPSRSDTLVPPASAFTSASPSVGELARNLTTSIALGDIAPLVVELFAASQAELDLCPATLTDVEAERDDRLALLLRPPEELVDLGSMEEELARPLRLVVVAVALLERRDVGADEPRLALLDPAEG